MSLAVELSRRPPRRARDVCLRVGTKVRLESGAGGLSRRQVAPVSGGIQELLEPKHTFFGKTKWLIKLHTLSEYKETCKINIRALDVHAVPSAHVASLSARKQLICESTPSRVVIRPRVKALMYRLLCW